MNSMTLFEIKDCWVGISHFYRILIVHTVGKYREDPEQILRVVASDMVLRVCRCHIKDTWLKIT